jgi:signal transduction histidine kinase
MDLAEFAPRALRRLNEGYALALEVDAPQPVPVSADPSALETILRNLLANAAKYAAHAGRLRVHIGVEGREAQLIVRDFGPGVTGDPRALFEPFARGDGPLVKSQPGVGLGLFLVEQLARALGGNVEARNAREGGSGFEVEVRLPLALEG